MEMYEVKAVMKYDYLAYKDGWELARLIAYLIALTNSKKRLKITDIIKFHWDKGDKADTSLSDENKKRLMNKARIFEQKLKK